MLNDLSKSTFNTLNLRIEKKKTHLIQVMTLKTCEKNIYCILMMY